MPKDDLAETSVRATIEGQNCKLLDWVALQFGIETPVSEDPRAATRAVNILLGRLRALGLPKHFFSTNPWEEAHPTTLDIQEFQSRPVGSSLNLTTPPVAPVEASDSSQSNAKPRGRRPKAGATNTQVAPVVPSTSPAPAQSPQQEAIESTSNGYQPDSNGHSEHEEDFEEVVVVEEERSALSDLASMFG